MKSVSCPRLLGKVSTDRLTKGVWVSRYKKGFSQNDIEYLPVILERSEKEVGNRIMKKYGEEWRIRAKVASIQCVFLYSMPASSLLITIWFLIFHFFMYAYHRSRMTAGVNCVSKEFLFFFSYFTWNGKESFWRKRKSFVFWCKKGKFLRLFF